MRLKRKFEVTLSLLTPLHVGSGKELQREFDYVTHKGKTWVMDADAFLSAIYWREDGRPDERILGRPASELLEDNDFRPGSDFFRYVLPGEPRAQGDGAVLREQYKDVHDRPYIPGSTLKGALRTVLAWHGFQEKRLTLNVDDLRGGRSWAGQGLEKQIFGKNPNYDLLRGLQVADSQPREQDRLQIVNAQVVTGGEKFGSPIELEAIRSDTVFTTSLTVDQYLATEKAAQELRFGKSWQWLSELPQIARKYGLERVQGERAWFQKRQFSHIADFYGQLAAALQGNGLGENGFLLHLGWGGGWQGKTIGHPLQKDSNAWERLLNDKRLSPARFRRQRGDDFPKSRRAVVANGRPVAPLGWCLVEMKEG